MTGGLLGAISTPFLSSFSDRIGRRPILAFAAIGPLVCDSIFLLVLRYPDSVDMNWLLVGSAMVGLSGSTIGAMSASQAYMTDLAQPRDRARLFSYLQAAMSFAGTLGPIIAGVLLMMPNSLERIYWLAFGAHLSLGGVFLYVLPESRLLNHCSGSTQDCTLPANLPRKSFVRGIFSSLKSLWVSSASRRKNICILAAMDFTIVGVLMGLPSLQLAYTAFMFHWQPITQSFYISLICAWSIMVLVILFPIVMGLVRQRILSQDTVDSSAVFNFGEVSAIRVNLTLQMVGYLGIIFARVPSIFILSSILVASAAPITPLLVSCLTAHVPSDQPGPLLGALSFLHALARIFIPAALNATYIMTIGVFPAALFLVLAIIQGGLLLASTGIEMDSS